jgi:decaprenyl-phosphate phosphoribosyltransferase
VPSSSLPIALFRLARPWQWAKSVFVLLGPLYGLRDMAPEGRVPALLAALGAASAFALASSACYIFNDLRDASADRAHPRKRLRPIASGAVGTGVAVTCMIVLALLASAALWFFLPSNRWLIVGLVLAAYVVNVVAYSLFFKRAVIADVVSLALGFVLRVAAGCFAAGIAPTTWLLNCTLFLAMFLAFGKRLGERRTAEKQGYDAADARGVQAKYTDDLLRMAVVVTSVSVLVAYAGYVQAREHEFAFALFGVPPGFNWLWLTLIPATFLLLRAMVLLERGKFDDPTEMALGDRPLQLGVLAFAALSAGVVLLKLSAQAPQG